MENGLKKINRNKLKKANDIFPDAIVDLINSFNACKGCIKTIDLIKNKPKEMNMEEANLWYFVKLISLPSRTVLNKQLSDCYQLERCTRSNWRCEDFKNYGHYTNWFNELWKPKTIDRSGFEIMLNTLRIMFSINGKQYKLEYPKIFHEFFFKDDIYNYLSRIVKTYRR